ncbi:NHL repeat-containing protein, partial [Burkholderia gladioli]|uniref:NHL repeat-containing protein n=1 Tax=Burkholderia gladioli TaxID=28095 RepID=UPI003F7ADDCA
DGMSMQSVPINLNFASTARFNYPQGVAVDSSGNIYVVDSNNRTIRKITPAGAVSTLAGVQGVSGYVDGTGANAEFNNPTGIAADSSGNLYVADTGNNVIRKISPAGVVSTLAGSSTGASGSADGTGSAARFNSPRGVTVDGSGNVYVADTLNSTIRKISSTGSVSTVAGTAGSTGSTDSSGASARFNTPQGIAVDSSGNLYVADTGNNTLREVSSTGVVSTLAGNGIAGSADGSGSAARFNGPTGVAVDSGGYLYVADTYNSAIRKISPAGAVTTLAGGLSSGAVDGVGTAAKFNYPGSVALDSSGYLYVGDTFNNTIRVISTGAVVNTLAGSSGSSGSANGSALQR